MVVVDMLVRFTSEEVYPAQKLKILVATGSVGGTPVISDSLSIYGKCKSFKVIGGQTLRDN